MGIVKTSTERIGRGGMVTTSFQVNEQKPSHRRPEEKIMAMDGVKVFINTKQKE